MKNNKEYRFTEHIDSVKSVSEALGNVGYCPRHYRKCDLEGKTICYRLMINDLGREYEVTGLVDCLKLIVNDAVMLGKMVDGGYVVED